MSENLLPKGYYRARAVETSYTLADDNNGNPRVGFHCEITQGPHAGERVPWRSGFGDKPHKNGKTSNDMVFETLTNAGWTGDDIRRPVGLGSVEVEIVVDHNTNPTDGKVYAEAKYVNKIGGGLFKKPMDEAKAIDFAEQMKAKVLLFRQKSGGGSGLNGSAPAGGGASGGGDAIPF